MGFAPWVGWRLLRRGTDKGQLSAMTLLAWVAIAVGIGAMGALLSVMYGFETALQNRVLKAYPHLLIRPIPPQKERNLLDFSPLLKEVGSLSEIERVVPYLEKEMILQSKQRTLGAVVWGVPAESLAQNQSDIISGKLPRNDAPLPQALIGSELSARLGVLDGERLRLISPMETTGAFGRAPKTQWLEVSGIFSSGHYEFDQQYLYLPLSDAQTFLAKGQPLSGIQIWAKKFSHVDRLKRQLQPLLGEGLEVVDWRVLNSALFHSLELEQYAMFTILSFAILIAVMNIIITLMMNISQKKRNIGVLLALGASPQQIRKCFWWQGGFVGGVGLVCGAVLMFLLIIYIRYFSHYQLPEIYYDRSLPIEVRPLSIAAIFGVAILMIAFASWIPAKRASKLDPIDAIRL